jgi:hypothetical protein
MNQLSLSLFNQDVSHSHPAKGDHGWQFWWCLGQVFCMSVNPKITDKYLLLVIPGYIDTANGEPLTCRELHDRFIISCNGKLPWSTMEFIRTVREIEHHDVVSRSIFAVEFHDNFQRKWTKQAVKFLVEATEPYIVKVIPKSHFRSSN